MIAGAANRGEGGGVREESEVTEKRKRKRRIATGASDEASRAYNNKKRERGEK